LGARSDTPELRHELKFVAAEALQAELAMALRLHPAGVRALHAPRTVQSLYLDTHEGRALQENLAGLSARRKLRFRWYGEGGARVRGTLEKKCRENSLGWKESVAVPGEVVVRGAERRAFVAALARALDPAWKDALAPLGPAQWVRYRREYFTTADRRVRLTLDRALACFDQRLLARLDDSAPTPVQRVLVLELKCLPEHLDLARALTARLPIPLGRCSKFVFASEPGQGPLVSESEA
jgi:hypothetical protein